MHQPDIDQTFDYETVSKRNSEFLVAYLKLTFGSAGGALDEAAAESLSGKLMQSMTDQLMLLGEVKRLYEVLDGFKRGHMPLAGEPGAPVLCTGCSLHGAQVPWPCETYQAASKALPERRP
jgi:hypothetical protein